ncbi:MAG TPA: hypothetical protein VF771_16135 [Longimicrobiaceae bacterium]
MLRKTLWLLGVLWLICVVALVVLYLVASKATATVFVQDLAKALLQLASVAVLAAVVSLVTTRFNRERVEADRKRDRKRVVSDRKRDRMRAEADRQRDEAKRLRENRDEFRKHLLSRVHQAWATAKRSKRLLRARGFSPPYYPDRNPDSRVLVAVYDEHMQIVNDVQLDLEMLAKEIEAHGSTFSDAESLRSAVKEMESRLKTLVTEYEKKRGAFSDDPPYARITELPVLAEFVGPAGQSGLAEAVRDAYAEAVTLLLADILDVEGELRSRSPPVANAS